MQHLAFDEYVTTAALANVENGPKWGAFRTSHVDRRDNPEARRIDGDRHWPRSESSERIKLRCRKTTVAKPRNQMSSDAYPSPGCARVLPHCAQIDYVVDAVLLHGRHGAFSYPSILARHRME